MTEPSATPTIEMVRQAEGAADAIGALFLAGRGPILQEQILAELVSRWLIGHPKYMRAELLSMHCTLVEMLNPMNEEALFGDAGHPGDRQ